MPVSNIEESDAQAEKGYPDLREKLQDVRFKSSAFFPRLLIAEDIREFILKTAGGVVENGAIIDTWYLEPGEPKDYKVELTPQEAESFLNAADRFFSNPLHGGAFDDALTDDLSNLLAGVGDRTRYVEIPKESASSTT